MWVWPNTSTQDGRSVSQRNVEQIHFWQIDEDYLQSRSILHFNFEI